MPDPLIAALDVDYRPDAAVAAGVWLRGWAATAAEFQAVVRLPPAAEYEPGAFYRRELPGLLAVLARGPTPDIVLIDGYVTLGDGAAGLGAHLSAALGGAVVVGVAKTRFAAATDAVPVLRGGSRSPLYVTVVGLPTTEAVAGVGGMAGPYRVPTLLKLVDRLARTVTDTDA